MTQIQTAKLSDSLRNIAASAEMEGLIFSPSLQEMCLSPLTLPNGTGWKTAWHIVSAQQTITAILERRS